LFCGVRSASTVQDILLADMQHEVPSQRLNAILRFRALWTHRYHVWSRLDEGAPNQLRLPPPVIEFVLPSPTLGYPGYEAPDPVWQIRKGTSAEEVQLKQNEATKTFVTASTSRRKQQQELLIRALAAESIRRRDARRHFHLTTFPVLERAAIEPAFSKEHREEAMDDGPNSSTGVGTGTVGGTSTSTGVTGSGTGAGGSGGNASGGVGASTGGAGGGATSSMQEEFAAAVRRLSVAPINRTLWNQTRNSSWRQGSIPWFRNCAVTHDDEDRGGTHSLFPSQPLQQAQCIFPSALCAATVPLIHLLDDTSVNEQGMADTTLFLRYILERLTRTKHKDELIFVLRKMIQRLPELPMQAAHAIFNNLVGYIMFHVRTPSFEAHESIASALSVVHLVIPHVQNIYFKDLKQTMRREQIDLTLLLTANLPCAKQFNVFDNDIGVAQLVRLQDENKDYQFEDILKDVLEANGIPVEQSHQYFLCDERSNIIRNSSHYVRDFYPFKRNHTPKLRLKQMEKDQGLSLLQRNALNLKFQEIGKVLFTNTVLKCTPSAQVRYYVLISAGGGRFTRS
uniref:Rho-GAP domain-containing protein n=1 Tax=Echinostoma caproni TaxID=27848 RepID=A0A183ALS2_9TREM